MAKVTLHIPTEQYGFCEVEYETTGDIQYAEAVREYDMYAHAFRNQGKGLPEKEMTDFLYAQVHGLGNHIETWEKMDAAQKAVVKTLKNALARKKPETP